jgi:hypothetical protein
LQVAYDWPHSTVVIEAVLTAPKCFICLVLVYAQVLIVKRVSDADAVLGLRAKVKSDAALRQAAKVREVQHSHACWSWR